jgi:hypothetical protein
MALKDTMRAGNPSGAALLAQLSVALILVFLLAEVRPLHASPGAEFTVSGSGVALRAQPRETANALLTLTPEHLLVEFERRGDWVRVGVYREVGAFGWVPADQLVPAPRAAAPATTTPEPPPPNAEPPVPPLLMEITGTPAVDIKGTCTLLGPPGGERTVTLVSRIPKSYRFKAAAVDCRIRKNDFFGRMRIRLYRDGVLLAGRRINGPFNQIWIRSAGPWGAARAILRGGLVVRDSRKPAPN